MGYTKQRAGITKRLESAKNRDLASGFLPVKQHTCRIVGHPIELIKGLMDLCWLQRIYLCSGAALAEIAQLLIWRLPQSAGLGLISAARSCGFCGSCYQAWSLRISGEPYADHSFNEPEGTGSGDSD